MKKHHTVYITEEERILLMKIMTGTNLEVLNANELRSLISLIKNVGSADLPRKN